MAKRLPVAASGRQCKSLTCSPKPRLSFAAFDQMEARSNERSWWLSLSRKRPHPETISRGNHPSKGRCLLPVNLPCFLIFLRDHHGREGHGGIASYQVGKQVSFLTQATRCYTDRHIHSYPGNISALKEIPMASAANKRSVLNQNRESSI